MKNKTSQATSGKTSGGKKSIYMAGKKMLVSYYSIFCIMEGYLGQCGRARQGSVTLAAHHHAAGNDPETQVFLPGGESENKRWVDPGGSDANREREIKLTLFSSSRMFPRRFLKRGVHPWHRSTFEARTGPAEDACQVTISIIISSSRELDTSAR